MTTVVAFHAHPDDEVLLTGGTLAQAAADGHRTVIVVATDGEMGAVPEGESLRMGELRASAAELGVHRVVYIGYADSGHGALLYPDPPGRTRFMRAPVDEAAERPAAVLREERADLLLSYDANGGYGHRDHVRVHEVGRRGAELAGVRRVLEATVPRDRMVRITRLLRLRYDLDGVFSPRSAITHTIDVRRYARQKQRALAAHGSVVHGTGRLAPVMRVLVRLPVPIFALLMGREWYVEAAGRR